jgi:hypothetical protein
MSVLVSASLGFAMELDVLGGVAVYSCGTRRGGRAAGN